MTKNELEEFEALPDFPIRLAEAMRAGGLTAEALANKVEGLGVACNRQHVNRMREGSSVNPSARLVHAITVACELELDFFFVGHLSAGTRQELYTRQQKRASGQTDRT